MVLEAVPLSSYPVILRHGAEPLFVVQKTTAIQSLHTPGGSTAWLVPGASGDGDAGQVTQALVAQSHWEWA